MSTVPERDLAHEADMAELHREQLRNDIVCDDDDVDHYEGYELEDSAPTEADYAELDADRQAQYQAYHS